MTFPRWPKVPPAPKVGEVNHHLFDRFTFVHFLIGCLYGGIQLSFFMALLLAFAWELVENPLKAYIPWVFPHATTDTWKNFFGDILAVLCGWILVSKVFLT